jgi:UPF0271 protein
VRVRLNIDLGERPGEPDALYALADVVNIACGGHAGDDGSMRAALAACAHHGAAAGAHPSFDDREGFGRRALSVAPATLFSQIVAQCTRLGTLAGRGPARVGFVKPHGALYHAADADPALARAVVDAAAAALGAVTVIGPAGGALAQAAATRGLPFWREGFADRPRLRADDGRWMLLPRDRPGAVIVDPGDAAALARELAVEGELETLCVHGDGASAEGVARAVRTVLDEVAGA